MSDIFKGWYTDTVEVYRVENTTVNYIQTQERKKVHEYACRIYRSQKGAPRMTDREASVSGTEAMSVPIGTDIVSGDELIITRGGGLGKSQTSRYFAGDIMPYYEPVGFAPLGLEHIEIGLLEDEVI